MKKRWFIPIAIIVLILLGIIIYNYLPDILSEDCGADLSCIRTAFDKCSFAEYQATKDLEQFCKPGSTSCSPGRVSIREYVQIRGSWIGGCKVYLKWTHATGVLEKWKNYDAKCVIDPNNYNLFDLNLYCKGKLLDAYDDAYYNPEYGFTGNIAPMN